MEGTGIRIAEEIIGGRRLKRTDDVSFLLTGELDELCRGADRIRAYFSGDMIDLCTIVNGRGGRCSENCKFCAQSSHYHTGAEVHTFLSPEEITADAKANEAEGVRRYSIVTAGRTLEGEDLQKAEEAYRRLSEETELHLCASHGLLSEEAFGRLKAAGVERYHANIETSRRNFPNICTTHTFEDKLTCIRRAREAGLSICSGGIMGLGENWEDRLDMAFCLSELHVDSIPLNMLIPIPGTPFGDRPQMRREEILRCIALFRYVNPEADIRLAAGRLLLEEGAREAFLAGANAAITGNMLTTSGNTIKEDRKMITEMGRSLTREGM